MTDPPPISSTAKSKIYIYIWKKMWHTTCDTWHVTRDTFGGVTIISKFQLPSSYRLWFMILWRSGGKGWLNELINDEAVYRTAPATPGLLKSPRHGGEMVWKKQSPRTLGLCFFSHHFSLMSGTLFFSEHWKKQSSLSLTSWHFSGPGFCILTKGVKQHPVQGQPCHNFI